MARIIHCVGEGRGFYLGITEYVILTDDPDVPDVDHVAPGFELDSVTEVGELPVTLPLEHTLIKF